MLLQTIRLIIPLLSLITVAAHAQTVGNTKAGNELIFTLKSELGVIDNFFYEEHGTDQVSFIKLAPKITIQTQFERHLLQLLAESEHATFNGFSQDNYSDFSIKPNYLYKLGAKQTFFVNGLIQEQYELRGTGLSLGEADSLKVGDTLQSHYLHGGFLYGSHDSVAKMAIKIGQGNSRYRTRRNLTRLLDKESIFINPSFDYLIGGGSYFATELKAERITFKRNEASSKNKYVGLLGFKWQSSSITNVELLLGYQEIQFIESSLANDSAVKWRVNIGWQPLEDLDFTLTSERDFTEANRLQDSYRLVDNIVLSASKQWNEYFNVGAKISYSNEDVISQTVTDTENYLSAKIEFKYQRNDWLSMSFIYDYQGLDSSVSGLDYQRNSLSLAFNVTL